MNKTEIYTNSTYKEQKKHINLKELFTHCCLECILSFMSCRSFLLTVFYQHRIVWIFSAQHYKEQV